MNKGFTLVELLAVIIILSAIVLITTISTRTIITNSKENLSDIQIKEIEKAAKMYYLERGNMDFEEEEYSTCVNLSDLMQYGYLDATQILNPKDGEEITGSVNIVYKSNKYTYSYSKEVCPSGS